MSSVARAGVFGGEPFWLRLTKNELPRAPAIPRQLLLFTVLIGKAEVEKQSTITDGS
jgi:hypothetical protein